MPSIQDAKLITAIKTPYLPNGKFDIPTFDHMVSYQIENGVQGIVVGGTTGEGQLMSWDEQIMLIAHCVHTFGNDVVVIGNTGSNNTREAVHATEQGFAVGMDASLQINPYYGKTSESGVLIHFQQTLELGPVMVYNVPARTGQDIAPHLIKQLAKHPNFIGVKECMGNERIAEYEKQGIACWSGNDDQACEAIHQSHAHGVISVTSNFTPQLMRRLTETHDMELNQQMQPLFDWLFSEPNPIPLNTALMMVDVIKPVFRLPYVPLSIQQQQQGISLLKQMNPNDYIGALPKVVSPESCVLL